ncbi:hypothetical protein [Holdemania massiliensis]|uniref:hypothetical protein n=1 Tax=Holdemania massiliensis TaxID=1468449 RepID=UPI001F051E36|nr:hypothetical protein [Holdemania massiliensis]MCH1942462.1 hypothetical protein [Holdemania massiliensis]
MKKFYSIGLGLILIFALTACTKRTNIHLNLVNSQDVKNYLVGQKQIDDKKYNHYTILNGHFNFYIVEPLPDDVTFTLEEDPTHMTYASLSFDASGDHPERKRGTFAVYFIIKEDADLEDIERMELLTVQNGYACYRFGEEIEDEQFIRWK